MEVLIIICCFLLGFGIGRIFRSFEKKKVSKEKQKLIEVSQLFKNYLTDELYKAIKELCK